MRAIGDIINGVMGYCTKTSDGSDETESNMKNKMCKQCEYVFINGEKFLFKGICISDKDYDEPVLLLNVEEILEH